MIDFNFDKDCCGCSACIDACPKSCIQFEKNSKGFLVPQVNLDVCIDCGLCNKVCPILNIQKSNTPPKQLYCAYNNDENIRKQGSSGSIFFAVAKYVIERGGCVCGAAFDNDLQLKHRMVDKIEDVYPLMKSKYIQSDTRGIYRRVKQELNKNRLVLFVGTPCQCQALYNYLGKKNYHNLILIDFICHGVPSQDFFDRSIKEYERQNTCKIISFNFREKNDIALRNCKLTRKFENGIVDSVILPSEQFPFYKAYLSYFIFRNSCYTCKFIGDKRITDFTIGDFWGLEHTGTLPDFNKGYSMLYVNSDRGNNLLHQFNDNLNLQSIEIEAPEAFNYAYKLATPRSILNRCFMFDYNRLSQERLEKRYCKPFRQNSFAKKVVLYIISKFKL